MIKNKCSYPNCKEYFITEYGKGRRKYCDKHSFNHNKYHREYEKEHYTKKSK